MLYYFVIAHNVKGLAMWRYSVVRLPGAAADLRHNSLIVYSVAWQYSSAETEVEWRYASDCSSVAPPYSPMQC